jgi:hypothetical protein
VGRSPGVWQQLQQLDIPDVLAKVCARVGGWKGGGWRLGGGGGGEGGGE